MKSVRFGLAAALSAGLLLWAPPTLADDTPDLRVSMIRVRGASRDGCLRKAASAMRDMGLDDVRIKDRELVQGDTRYSRAIVMCVRHEGDTLATIAVTSNRGNDARSIRNSLRERMRD